MKNYKKFMLGVAAICMSASVFAQEMGSPVLIKAGGENIDCQPSYAAPLVADFDKDGLDDLIVGTFKGEFRFYKSTGSKTNPQYKDFSLIQANGKTAVAQNW